MACETIPALPIGLPGDIPGCCAPTVACCAQSEYEGKTLNYSMVATNTSSPGEKRTGTLSWVSGSTFSGTINVSYTMPGSNDPVPPGMGYDPYSYQGSVSISCTMIDGQPVYDITGDSSTEALRQALANPAGTCYGVSDGCGDVGMDLILKERCTGTYSGSCTGVSASSENIMWYCYEGAFYQDYIHWNYSVSATVG